MIWYRHVLLSLEPRLEESLLYISVDAVLPVYLSLLLIGEASWSLLNRCLKFPSWPSSAPFTCPSTHCSFSLWWVQVEKKSLPSSPNLFFRGPIQDDKSWSFTSERVTAMLLYHQRGRCHTVGWQQGVDLKVLSSSPGVIRGGPVDAYWVIWPAESVRYVSLRKGSQLSTLFLSQYSWLAILFLNIVFKKLWLFNVHAWKATLNTLNIFAH